MEALIALWVPILLAAIVMFGASAIAWMVLPHHRKDWVKLPDEEAAKAALAGVETGQYMVPHGAMSAGWWAAILLRRQPVNMGKNLGLWFLNLLLIAAMTAYIIYFALPPEADYLFVFRIAGTALALGHIGALFARAIFWGWKWSSILIETIEGLVYAVLAAGVFGWWWVR